MPFTLPDLPYEKDALAPHIDALTMEIHHGKHHNGYVTKLNAALQGTDYESKGSHEDLVEMLKDLENLPDEIKTAVRNNGGGHANHSLFWEILTPNGGIYPTSGALYNAVIDAFGSFEKLKETFTKAASTRFGSGWAWLAVNALGMLEVISTPNQDSPYSDGETPILGLDVWEHAYYLNYQNRRPDYIDSFWKIVNWDKVEENYKKAIS